VPILGILVVLPASEVSGISGFLDAVKETFRGVYGGAATVLIDLMTVSFVVALLTQGCTWLMGTDRMMAAAAADGAYPRYLGRFDPRLRTPVRVNVLSGIVALAFMFAAQRLSTGSAGATFKVVLSISISTLVIALTMLFPAAIKLRRSAAEVERPFRVPGGERGIWLAAGLCAFWCAFSSLETVFPGTVERLFGEGYSFEESWGMSQLRFEAFTLGTLAVLTAIGVGGYLWAQREQRGEPAAGPPGVDPIQAVALPQQASE
jgi:amino acid transporter